MPPIGPHTDLVDLSVSPVSSTAVFLVPLPQNNIVIKTFSDKGDALRSNQSNTLVGGMGFDVPEQSLSILKKEKFPQRLKELYSWLDKLYTLNMSYLSGQSLTDYLKNASPQEREYCARFIFNDLVPSMVGGIGNLDFNPTNLIVNKISGEAEDYESYLKNTKFNSFDFEAALIGRENSEMLTDLADPVHLVAMYQGSIKPNKHIRKAVKDLHSLFTEEEMKICAHTTTQSLKSRMKAIDHNKEELCAKGLEQKANTVKDRLQLLHRHFKGQK